jgi:hypothetical protein
VCRAEESAEEGERERQKGERDSSGSPQRFPKTRDFDRDTRGKNAWGDQGADMAVISGFYHVWAWVLIQIRFE